MIQIHTFIKFLLSLINLCLSLPFDTEDAETKAKKYTNDTSYYHGKSFICAESFSPELIMCSIFCTLEPILKANLNIFSILNWKSSYHEASFVHLDVVHIVQFDGTIVWWDDRLTCVEDSLAVVNVNINVFQCIES